MVLFTFLLLADSLVFASGNYALSSAALASIEQRESWYASLLVGSAAYSALGAAQTNLVSGGVSCLSPAASLASLHGIVDGSGDLGGIGYSTQAAWSVAPSPGGGGLTMMGGFDGWAAGELNVAVDTTVNEAAGPGLPAYSVHEVHLVHVWASLDRVVGICRGASAALSAGLAGVKGCNASAAAGVLAGVRGTYQPMTRQLGLEFSAAAGLSRAGPCIADYSVTVTESSARGVTGSFEWSAHAAGSLTLPTGESPPSSAGISRRTVP